eukprot:99788-Pelagomonas_calceolata.AAC.1
MPPMPPLGAWPLFVCIIKRPENSLSPGALVVWCKFGNPPFPAKMGARQPLGHTKHLHMSDFLHFSMLEPINMVGLLRACIEVDTGPGSAAGHT